MLADLIQLVENKTISSKQAKEVLYDALTEDKVPTAIVEEKGLKQIGGEDEILKVVLEVLEEKPEAIEQYKKVINNKPKFIKIPFLVVSVLLFGY